MPAESTFLLAIGLLIGDVLAWATVRPLESGIDLSIVGEGIHNHPGYAAQMFGALADEGINISMISTSEIRITCIIAEDQLDTAVGNYLPSSFLGLLRIKGNVGTTCLENTQDSDNGDDDSKPVQDIRDYEGAIEYR